MKTHSRNTAATQIGELNLAPSDPGDLALNHVVTDSASRVEEVELPEGWQIRRLGDVGSVRYGLGQPPKQDPAGLPIIRATNVKRGRISKEGLIRIKASALPAGRNPFLKAGDIIVVRSGAYTGDVAMVTPEWEGAVAGYDLVLSLRDHLDSSFCAFQMLTNEVQGYFHGQRDRSAQPHLNRQQLEAAEILVPPVAEQRAIASVLRTVQEAKEACERVLAATRQLKQSLLHHLFTYGPVPFPQAAHVPLKETEIGEVPESWPVVSIGELATLVQYGTSSRCEVGGPGFPVLRIPNVVGGAIDTTELKYLPASPAELERHRLKSGDILFVRTNGVRENVGRCAVYRDKPEDALFASYMIRARLSADKALPEFVQLFTETKAGRASFYGRASGAADGKFNINSQTIRSTLVPLPLLSEQRQIARQLAAVGAKLAALESRRAALAALFTSLLHHLLTARLRLPEFAGGSA